MRNITWPPSGAPAIPVNERAWRFGQQQTAAQTNPLLALNPTFLLAGASPASIFAQNSDGTSVNTADGQVVGYVQDLTANAANGTQTVTNNKPLYYANGTTKGFRGGYTSGQRRWLEVPFSITDYYHVFVVYKPVASNSTVVPFAYRVDGTLPGGNGNVYPILDPTSVQITVAGVGNASSPVTRALVPYVSELSRESVGYYFTHSLYQIDGSSIASAQVSSALTSGVGKLFIGGSNGSDLDPCDSYLVIAFNQALSAGDRTTLFSYIASTYGAL